MDQQEQTVELTEEDIKFLNFRVALIKFIGEKTIVEKIKEIIINSKYFSFTSERSAKFINFKNLEFSLSYDKAKLNELIPPNNLKDIDDEVSWVGDCVRIDIFDKIGDFIVENISRFITDKSEDDSIYINKNIRQFKTFSTIYTVLIESKASNCVVKYLLF